MATTTKSKTKPAKPDLTMKYAGGFVQHLGLSMYGGAVPAIAELIANAWDADATRVDIEFPFEETGGAGRRRLSRSGRARARPRSGRSARRAGSA